MTTLTHPLPPLPLDDRRGTVGMLMFIVTEASLFVMLFFSYFYLGRNQPLWPPDPPPSLRLPLVMLAVLVTSSVVLHLGERALERGARTLARPALALTMLLGLMFLGLQTLEYVKKSEMLLPTTSAYGSIVYAITGFHALHVVVGVLLLGFVLLLPALEPTPRPPHRPLRAVSMYWHFVDAVWLCIVAIIYVLPHFQR